MSTACNVSIKEINKALIKARMNEKINAIAPNPNDVAFIRGAFKDVIEPALTYKNQSIRTFRFNWFCGEYLKYLNARLQALEFKTNSFEETDIDTPQIRLRAQDPDLFLELFYKFFNEISEVCTQLSGVSVVNINEILIAKYDNEFEVDSYHVDRDSDLTVVVPINEDFACGDFEIHSGGIFGEVINIPRASLGEATMFLGKTHYHKNSKVTDGKRLILVFWCDTNKRTLHVDDSPDGILNQCKIDLQNAIVM